MVSLLFVRNIVDNFYLSNYRKSFNGGRPFNITASGKYKYWRNAIMTDIIILNAGIIAVLIGLLLPAVQKVR